MVARSVPCGGDTAGPSWRRCGCSAGTSSSRRGGCSGAASGALTASQGVRSGRRPGPRGVRRLVKSTCPRGRSVSRRTAPGHHHEATPRLARRLWRPLSLRTRLTPPGDATEGSPRPAPSSRPPWSSRRPATHAPRLRPRRPNRQGGERRRSGARVARGAEAVRAAARSRAGALLVLSLRRVLLRVLLPSLRPPRRRPAARCCRRSPRRRPLASPRRPPSTSAAGRLARRRRALAMTPRRVRSPAPRDLRRYPSGLAGWT